jgi:DNA repair photolyase
VSKPQQFELFPEASEPTLRDVANAVKEAGIEGLPGAVRRADTARYQEVRVRSALVKVEGMPFKWALNTYRGCTHACEYCYARKYQRHLELGTGQDFSSFILVKMNLPERLRHEVTRATWARENVAVGTATDCYQPIEGHYRITRRALEVLVAAETPFSIVTKGPMIVRDADVLVEATKRAGCQVFMSVPSVDEAAWTTLEPGTAPPKQRLRALRSLADRGINTAVLMMPLVPGLTTSRTAIEKTIRAVAAEGLRLGGACVARLDAGVKEHFLDFLAREHPELVDGYKRLYPRAHVSKEYAAAVKETVARAESRSSGKLEAPVFRPARERRV